MKLIVIIIIASLVQVSAATFGQQITLSKDKITLKALFKEITKQTGYEVIYANKTLDDQQTLHVSFKKAPLNQVLDASLKGLQVTYVMDEKGIVIKEKVASLLDRIKNFLAAKDINGIVEDESGNPLPGASIRVKNSDQSTAADADGKFYLKNVADNAVLVISYLGYTTREVNVGLNLIRFRLEKSSSKLDEVQIEAYSRSSKRVSVNDITTVKAIDFEKQPIDNPLKALQGRIPGLIITPTSGMPGSAITLQLRGQNSLAGPLTQPLIVLDGVPITNNIQGGQVISLEDANISSLAFINPADIESIDVLKDADATSIYGSKGANGVILITTKKGKAGESRINVSSYTGYSQRVKEIAMMNTQQYLSMRRDAYIADGLEVPTDPHNDYEFTVWDQNRNTDWQKTLLNKNAFYTKNDASISGGTTLLQYLVSGNYSKQTYAFDGPGKFETAGAHFSIAGSSSNKKFKAVLSGTYSANNNVAAVDPTTTAVAMLPNAPALYNANGDLNWEPGPDGYATWTNPLARLANETYQKSTTFYSSLNLSYKIIPSLTFETTAGITSIKLHDFNDLTIASQDPAKIAIASGYSIFTDNSSGSWSLEPKLIYNHAIGRGVLNVIVGASLDERNQLNQRIEATGYNNDALLHSLASASAYGAGNEAVQYRSEGVYARATYNWDDKYLLSLNGRRDGSSRFGIGNQFGNFASAGIGWVFTNEEFVKKALPFVSFGKLRFSAGTSGNDAIGDYQAVGYYQTLQGNAGGLGAPITYQGIKTIYSSGPFNPDFHWETVYKMEVGFDLGFFNDRIVLNGNYFRNRSSDQLSLINLPATAGGGTITVNLPAKIQNMGGDLSINTVNIKSKNFTWSTSGNISFQRNKLLSLPTENYQSNFPGYQYYVSRHESPVGKAFTDVAAVYGFRGVDPATGVYMFTGYDGSATTFDQANPYGALVSTNPKYYGGLGNTFNYKNVSLTIFLQFMKRNGLNYIYQGFSPLPPGYAASTSDNVNQPVAFTNYWKKPGDITPIQRVSSQGYYIDQETGNFYDLVGSQAAAANSTALYTDASFIRVKSATLSYSIPDSWKRKIGVRNLTFSISAENLWTITGYKGADPETQSIYSLQPLRSVTAGFNIGL